MDKERQTDREAAEDKAHDSAHSTYLSNDSIGKSFTPIAFVKTDLFSTKARHAWKSLPS